MRLLSRLLSRRPSASVASSQKDLLISLLIMAWIVEARDPYTGGHLWRVSRFAHGLAQALGVSAEETARIAIGGFLHDLGKIGVPDRILNKRDRLTDDEYAVIRTHPDIGWRMLADHPLAHLAESAIRFHHEMPNGKGYPAGMHGTDIPLDARVVGICDAFDAMTSTRPYRSGMPIDKALSIIEAELGSQFDRDIGSLFVQLGRQGRWNHIVGHTDDGIPLQVCGQCGPTVVVRKEQRHGEHAYCPNCTTEFEIDRKGKTVGIAPTGRKGNAANVQPTADIHLLERLLAESAAVFS